MSPDRRRARPDATERGPEPTTGLARRDVLAAGAVAGTAALALGAASPSMAQSAGDMALLPPGPLPFDLYRDRYPLFGLDRDDAGVLTITLSDGAGGSAIWGLDNYRQAISLFRDVAMDRGNRVVVLTGRGDDFIGGADLGDPAESGTPQGFDEYYAHGSRIALALLDIDAPVIAAVNGPHRIHTELSLLSDTVIASETVVYQNAGHIPGQIVPGDGTQVLWEELIGPVRARHFLWTAQELNAATCLDWGVVNEVLPPAEVLPRAQALAAQLAELPDLTLRYTRMALVQRLRRRFAEAVPMGMALEGLTVVDVLGG